MHPDHIHDADALDAAASVDRLDPLAGEDGTRRAGREPRERSVRLWCGLLGHQAVVDAPACASVRIAEKLTSSVADTTARRPIGCRFKVTSSAEPGREHARWAPPATSRADPRALAAPTPARSRPRELDDPGRGRHRERLWPCPGRRRRERPHVDAGGGGELPIASASRGPRRQRCSSRTPKPVWSVWRGTPPASRSRSSTTTRGPPSRRSSIAAATRPVPADDDDVGSCSRRTPARSFLGLGREAEHGGRRRRVRVRQQRRHRRPAIEPCSGRQRPGPTAQPSRVPRNRARARVADLAARDALAWHTISPYSGSAATSGDRYGRSYASPRFACAPVGGRRGAPSEPPLAQAFEYVLGDRHRAVSPSSGFRRCRRTARRDGTDLLVAVLGRGA